MYDIMCHNKILYMQNKHSSKNKQARRILGILRLFLVNRKLTTAEVILAMREDYPEVSDRSIQRDLKILCDEGFIELQGKGRNSCWVVKQTRAPKFGALNIRESEMISFHILKSYLQTFKGTTIENDINELSQKLETLAPGTVFMEEQFYGDQNIGNYDYSDKHEILRLCIKHINEKNWIEIRYERITDGEIHDYEIFPQFLYTYSGAIYLVAYNPRWKRSTNFAVQNIMNISEVYDAFRKEPDFDYEAFRVQRFAVFDGELADVELRIREDYVKYFENRHWHSSQRIHFDRSGEMTMELTVPLSPDFISWICRWNEAITVLKPQELIDGVKRNLQKALDNYE